MTNLIQAWKNRGQILEGIQNAFFNQTHVEEIAEVRMQMCVSCTSFDTQGSKCFVAGTQPCCAECGCSLKFKVRALSASCPLAKWPAVLSEAEDDALTAKLQS